MVEHQSKEVVDKISDELKIQPALRIPRDIEDKIKLVYNVNPEKISNIVRGVSRSTTGTLTVFTTPTDRDFFLTSVNFNLIKDVVHDKATGDLTLNCTIDGASQELLTIPLITLTVQEVSLYAYYNKPIKLDRGTTINSPFVFTAGVGIVAANIIGYTTDPQ